MSKILIDAGPSGAGWSSIEAFTSCPQRFAYRLLFPGGLGSRDPLVRGSIGHVGLAHLYARVKALQTGTDPDAYWTPDEAMKLVAPKWGDQGMNFLDLCCDAVRGYGEFYAEEAATMRVFGVEHFVETTVPTRYGPRRFTARIDLILADRTDRYWIHDHKFLSDASEQKSIWRYTLSGQFLGLHHFGRMLFGDRFAGVKVNIVGVGRGDLVFRRVSPEPAWNALRRFPRALADAFERIEELKDRDLWDWPKAFSERSCVNPYGKCEGFELCQKGEDALVVLGHGESARRVPAAAIGSEISMAAWVGAGGAEAGARNA